MIVYAFIIIDYALTWFYVFLMISWWFCDSNLCGGQTQSQITIWQPFKNRHIIWEWLNTKRNKPRYTCVLNICPNLWNLCRFKSVRSSTDDKQKDTADKRLCEPCQHCLFNRVQVRALSRSWEVPHTKSITLCTGAQSYWNRKGASVKLGNQLGHCLAYGSGGLKMKFPNCTWTIHTLLQYHSCQSTEIFQIS